MTIIVEDGTAKSDAESYASVANADAYWTARNVTAWGTATTAAKEAALREATLYLEGNYRWIGTRTWTTQALSWPRVIREGIDLNGKVLTSLMVPGELLKACCELAYEVISNGSLLPSMDRGGLVKSESVGPLAVVYMDGAPSLKSFPMVDMLLHPILSGGAKSLSVDARRA